MLLSLALPLPPHFGSKSLRLSNAYGTGVDTYPPEYEKQTYSKPAKEPAGQDLPNTEFTGQFSFISIHPDQYQPRLNVTVSPDNGHGGRMSYIGLVDTADGKIAITFYDTNSDGDWVPYDLGTVPRNVPHTIKFWMRLIPGPNNDLVRISIDGQDAGQCFTTWESSNKVVPISDRLLFLSGNRDGNRLGLLGGGYLFDNVSVTTGGDGPPGCDLPIEKKADSQTVRAGGLAGYGITVRNRGHVAARNLQVCDQIPRRMTFVSANREMSRDGRRRCFVISLLKPGQRASVHLMLRVNANAPAGTVDNTVDITPVPPTDRPSLPGLPGQPGQPVPPPGPFAPGLLPLVIEALPPGAVLAAIPPIAKAKARVKVVARLTPRVTG